MLYVSSEIPSLCSLAFVCFAIQSVATPIHPMTLQILSAALLMPGCSCLEDLLYIRCRCLEGGVRIPGVAAAGACRAASSRSCSFHSSASSACAGDAAGSGSSRWSAIAACAGGPPRRGPERRAGCAGASAGQKYTLELYWIDGRHLSVQMAVTAGMAASFSRSGNVTHHMIDLTAL